MVYEAMLLFGVLFIASWLFSTLLQQRHALYMRTALQEWLFIVLGFYFTWFWTHGGQTLAMKTWRIKLVNAADGKPLSIWKAVLRYLLAWGWFIPGLAFAWFIEAKGWLLIAIPALNVLIWSLIAFTDKEQRFLHDRIAGTALVNVEIKAKEAPL